MAVTRCPQCGDLYLAATARCASCDVELEAVEDGDDDERGDAGSAGGAAGEVGWGQVRHELHDWTMEGRRLLDGMLGNAGIPRSWQGTVLAVPAAEEERVAEMVAMVAAGDARVGLSDSGDGTDAERGIERAAGDGGAEGEVAYDLTGWSDLARGDLVAALADAEVSHDWDEDGDLVVAVEDEARVDAIFARLTDEDADVGGLDEDDIDGMADDDLDDADGLFVQETLSDLFIGADRLMRNPLDGSAGHLVIGARERIRSMRLPFGFERRQWRTILTAADDLADSFVPGEVDDDAVRERASTLRGLLRDVV